MPHDVPSAYISHKSEHAFLLLSYSGIAYCDVHITIRNDYAMLSWANNFTAPHSRQMPDAATHFLDWRSLPPFRNIKLLLTPTIQPSSPVIFRSSIFNFQAAKY